jgi:hypothetical protein
MAFATGLDKAVEDLAALAPHCDRDTITGHCAFTNAAKHAIQTRIKIALFIVHRLKLMSSSSVIL